ncbi:MAG: glutamate 5-kinase [Oscillospiraceae bacterium]|nr:glutamate 5-kinase [Oscillospiraceae bacterium]MDD6503070.1 glutamate 5-kinase [Oscillospiraceae bacterium]MDY4104632.1 glutamate 5-kinase [Oscillospiraceae bacterium]
MLDTARTIVCKVGTSTLTHETGRTNLRCMEELVTVLSDLMNQGRQVVLVTSGAIGVGVGKLGLSQRPKDTAGKQAAATVGQCELMFMYDKMFSQYGHKVGQLLITKEDVDDPKRRQNLVQTFEKLFDFGAIPIINENDAVAVDEIVYGDNDSLSAVVATLIHADALVILTETDGLYTANPMKDPDARRIARVEEITDEIRSFASGDGTALGTGGMVTKLHAAEIATAAGVDTYVICGKDPRDIYRLMDGADIGTHFIARRSDGQ